VDWAIAHRVNAGEDDIIIMPSTFGAGLDPSTRKRDRNPALFGTGKWNRVLIDATMNLDYDPRPRIGRRPLPAQGLAGAERQSIPPWRAWTEFGLDKPEDGLGLRGRKRLSLRAKRSNLATCSARVTEIASSRCALLAMTTSAVVASDKALSRLRLGPGRAGRGAGDVRMNSRATVGITSRLQIATAACRRR